MHTEKKDGIIKGIILICNKMLNNEENLLTGCHEITHIFHEGLSAGIFHESDEIFSIFRGVESETDYYERKRLLESGMNEFQIDKEFNDTIEYYRNEIINGCKELLVKLAIT